MTEKLKAGITGTGFRFASPWEQFETLSKLGYHTSQNAVASIAGMEGNLDENIARFKELNLGFYSSSLVKPMGMPRMGGDIKDMCTIKEGYMDMGLDHITTTDQVIEDTIARCDIAGASDTSIRNAEPNDIGALLRKTQITRIYATGAKSAQLYRRLIEPQIHVPITQLPSTSAANAAWPLERLIDAYRVIL